MKRFEKSGVLALEPQAFFGFFDEAPEPENEETGAAIVVNVRGPLAHHAGGWCDSYDAIRQRVAEACAGRASVVVLRIDSPGGEASGCLDTARALRAMVSGAGKRLVAYVDGSACSAAYALACAAERIVASPSAAVGSIGMIASRVDATAADERWGLKWALVSSGARKADGNEHTAMSELELAALQETVDFLARQFFELVAEARGTSVDAVSALEAGVFRGAAMVERGLVDELASFDSLLATVASGGLAAGAAANEGTDMDEDEKQARAALQAILDDEEKDEKSKAKARKALAAMDDEDEPSAEDEGGDDDDAEEPAATTSATAPAATVDASAVRAIVAEALAARDEQTERAQLIASRPDLDAATLALLETAPLARVRSYVESTPRRAYQPAAAGSVQPTLGEGQGGAASRLAPEAKAELDARMGLTPTRAAVKDDGQRQLFGVPTKVTPGKPATSAS